MTKRDKLLAKIRNNPNAVRFEDLAKVLEWHGFELRRIRGSHHVFRREQEPPIVVSRRRTPHVSPSAVKEVIQRIDEAMEEE